MQTNVNVTIMLRFEYDFVIHTVDNKSTFHCGTAKFRGTLNRIQKQQQQQLVAVSNIKHNIIKKRNEIKSYGIAQHARSKHFEIALN